MTDHDSGRLCKAGTTAKNTAKVSESRTTRRSLGVDRYSVRRAAGRHSDGRKPCTVTAGARGTRAERGGSGGGGADGWPRRQGAGAAGKSTRLADARRIRKWMESQLAANALRVATQKV